MATNTAWKVIYHFEQASSHRAGWDAPIQVTVLAADDKENTIKNVLTTNNIARPGATIVIDHVSRASLPGGSDNVLS